MTDVDQVEYFMTCSKEATSAVNCFKSCKLKTPFLHAVAINGSAVNFTAANNYEYHLTAGTLDLTAHKYRTELGQSVHMTTDLYNLLVYVTPRQYDQEIQQLVR